MEKDDKPISPPSSKHPGTKPILRGGSGVERRGEKNRGTPASSNPAKTTTRVEEAQDAEAASTGGVEHSSSQEAKATNTSGSEPIRQ